MEKKTLEDLTDDERWDLYNSCKSKNNQMMNDLGIKYLASILKLDPKNIVKSLYDWISKVHDQGDCLDFLTDAQKKVVMDRIAQDKLDSETNPILDSGKH